MISVSNGMAGLGVISLMYFFQINYDTGFASNWWLMVSGLYGPVAVLLALSGWVIYRYRQTRAMTLPEFFEMRYSRSFRVFAGLVAFTSGILNFGIFPSIGSRFFIFFCDLPFSFSIPGIDWEISTYAFLMVALLAISVFFTFIGGQIAVMFTDFVQGVFTTLVFAVVIGYLFYAFSKTEIAETLLAAPAGHSLVNPFDIGKDANFNPSFYFIAIFMDFYLLLAWQGSAGYNCCAKNPHEAKMAKVLEPWKLRAILPVLLVFLPIAVHVYTEHDNYSSEAMEVKGVTTHRVQTKLKEYALDRNTRWEDYELLSTLDVAESDVLTGLYRKMEDGFVEQDYSSVPALAEKTTEQVGQLAQLYHDKTDEITSQIRLPLVIGKIIPFWLRGLFCAAMLAAFISTHNTYLHSWGAMFMQDVVLPFKKKKVNQKQHLKLLRLAIIGVSVYVFVFSLSFTHSQRIMMYCQITASIFFGGAGTVIIGGLYWKKGTNKAAWLAMACGLLLSIFGIITTQSGLSAIDSAVQMPFWQGLSSFLAKINCNEAFWGLIRFIYSLNSQQFLFMTCCVCILIYIVTSLLTCRTNFNMDKLLHRGRYAVEGDQSESFLAKDTVLTRLGFSRSFTKGDYIIATVSLIWPFVWLAVFILGAVYRKRISDQLWFEFWYYWMWGMYILGLIITVWLTFGGIRDMKDFIKQLKSLSDN
ncbi:sodium:solute symporter family protein [Limihaloglobus sulfuriphilus]|nr:hypothetical protein [Limihaloglobus sulfuriphilus]